MTRGERRRRILAWQVVHAAILIILAGGAGTAGVLWGVYTSMSQVLPSRQQIATIRPSEGTLIYSSDGVLLAKVATENREIVPLSHIPDYLIQATVAIEDKRFYSHPGVDVRGIARALFENLRRGYAVQGGSTLTQQLARNLYLTRKKTIARKLQEAILALQLERNYTKDEILELYLNQVYYGHGAYGVQVASEVYFRKKPRELSVAESALLAGLTRRPLDYSPYEYPENAKRRRNLVLQAMASMGYVTADQAQRAMQEPLRLAPAPKPFGLKEYHAPYFTSWLLRQLVRRYGADWVYKGGLRIYSTVNWQMQQHAERALREGVEQMRRRGVNTGALVAIDPHTGGIKAMVGGVDFAKSEVNCATRRVFHPGSAFKIFDYTAAIEDGFTPDTIIVDSPVRYPNGTGGWWVPKNAHGGYSGPVTVRTAVAKSINVCAVKVADKIGIDKVIDVAHRMGLRGEIHPYLSTALGAVEVSPLEMCSAAGVLATGGLRLEPFAVARVLDRYGNPIEQAEPRPQRVLSDDTARTMTDILSSVIQHGTGYPVKRYFNGIAAGKTGTTNDFRDAWFVGYTRHVACAVWVGDQNRKPMAHIFGATVPAPVWARFMAAADPLMRKWHTSAPPPEETVAAEETTKTVTLCAQTGLLANPQCPDTYEQVFAEGENPPTRHCDLHTASQGSGDAVSLQVCAETGKLATGSCPRVVTRRFRAEDAPTEYCPLHP